MCSVSPLNVFESTLSSLPQQLKQIFYLELNQLINYSPTIGLMGKSGVGKSSLCNALFQTKLAPVSDIEGCTRNANKFILNTGVHQITFVDLPGIGEDLKHDYDYRQLYADILPELDLILWVLKADDRAWAADEQFYSYLIDECNYPKDAFLFILNQADKIEPCREWLIEQHQPSNRQQLNLQLKINLVNEFFSPVYPVVAVSALEQYQLDILTQQMIYALPAQASSAVFRQLKKSYRTGSALDTAKNDFGDSVGDIVDDILNLMPLPKMAKQIISSVKNAVVSFAKSVWDLFF